MGPSLYGTSAEPSVRHIEDISAEVMLEGVWIT